MLSNFRDALLLEAMFAQWLSGISVCGDVAYSYNTYSSMARETFINKLRRITND